VSGYIYLATNTNNGKRYVGQTRQLVQTRWRRHVSDALGTKERPHPLHNAIRKHGAEVWIVETIATVINVADLDALERAMITRYQTLHPRGYNLKPGGNSAGHHPETKAKLAAALRGRRLAPDVVARLRDAGKRRPQSPGQLAGLAKCHERNRAIAGKPGRKMTPEQRAKLSAALRGKPKSPEHRARIGAAHVGMKRSAETKRRIGDATLARVAARRAAAAQSPEAPNA